MISTNISVVLKELASTYPKYPLVPSPLKIVTIECGDNYNKAFIDYEADPRIYDSGQKLIVVYERNRENPEAIENLLLDYDDKEDAVWDAVYEVLPSITHFYPTITRITLQTIDGKLRTAVTDAMDEIPDYPPIPESLSHVLTVPITELEKLEYVCIDVDCVRWQDETYAFKRTGENLEGTVRELTILDKLSFSPSIISLEAIVVNGDQRIRGFLMPLMPPGDLERVFRSSQRSGGLTDDSEDMPVFDWPLKLSWARQVSRGVADLHTISAYNGDIKLQNVLLNPAGEAILIDFLPMGISDQFAAPEVLERMNDHGTSLESVLTASADVYSLGLVLWAIAEEKWETERPPMWRSTRTPAWYINVVQRCLALDPEARPSVEEICSGLKDEEA